MKNCLMIRCAASALAVLVSGSVLAQAPAEPSRVVNYRDLNLQSQHGVAALYKRIERAAEEVCQLPRGTLQLKIETEIKACRAEATDRAVLQTNMPALSALHLAKTGRRIESPQYADRR